MEHSPERDLLPWFALMVKPQHEKAVVAQLELKLLEAYLPLHRARRRWSDRMMELELPLFPRYVFSRFSFDDRLKVLRILSVTSIVSFGGKPCPLDSRQIAAIQSMIASGKPVLAWPYLKIGQRVRISNGPLEGLEGILAREKSQYRLVVNVDILNRAVAVEVERESITPLSSAAVAAGIS
jgi:transcription antitermination factor NusG